MTKINPNKLIQKRRTAQEMHDALYAFRIGSPELHNDIDDTDTVFSDVIEELLEARAIIEDIRGFVQSTYQKMNRR